MPRPPHRPARRKSALTQTVSFGLPLLIVIALPVVVFVTYSPGGRTQPRFLAPERTDAQAHAQAGREIGGGRVMVAPSIRRPSKRRLVEHACDAVRDKIVAASSPTFPDFDTNAYGVAQLGNITWEVTGTLDIPNAFGSNPTKPFVVHLRLVEQRNVRATYITVDGQVIYGKRG